MNPVHFARLFDAQYRHFNADLPLWRRLAGQYGDPILELGCGPGRVLLDLAALGYQVTGVDNDPEMLQRAAAKTPPDLQPLVELIACDLRSLSLSGSYRLAIAPCNTLAYLNDAEAADCLARLAAVLQPGAGLAADLPSPSLADLDPEDDLPDAFHEPERGTDVEVTATQAVDRQARRVDVVWRYDEMLADGGVERVEVPLSYHLRTQDQVREMWRAAGFENVRAYGDYAGSPFSPQSVAMLVVAKRAA